MSYTGTGTQQDPYIVDNWADLDYLAGNSPSGKYIKWSDEGSKIISVVIWNLAVNWYYAADIDFNGWKIEQFNVNISGGGQHDNALVYAMTFSGNIRNLSIDHIYIKDPRVTLRGVWYNVYINDMEVDQLPNNYDFWTFDQGRDANYGLFSPFRGAALFSCILHFRSQDYSIRFPYAFQLANCEIYIDYKWTQTDASNLWVFGGDVYIGVNAANTYIAGKIDASAGSGTLRLFKTTAIDRTAVRFRGNVIINIETIVGENSSLSIGKNVGLYDNNAHPLIVTDNGNNSAANDSSAPDNLKIIKADLRDPEVLSARGFPFAADNDIRNPQYNSESDDWTFRQSEYINSGFPFMPFYTYPIYEPPVIYPIERADRICIYDIYEPQSGYDHNGVAVLFPSEVTSYKEDMGRWDINLKHPIDQYGKWSYIIIQNCVKVNGQIFRIDETEIYTDANQQYVKAHANHITYDLNDAFIGDAQFEVHTGNAYLYQIQQASKTLIPTQEPTPYEYSFELTSDITGDLAGDFHDQTVTGAIYGDDNSFANRYGGKLYRDNFHMSINSTMENLPLEPAFQLRYGTDLTKISYKIDCSRWITELICVDNNGNEWAVSYVGSEWIIHHNKTKRIRFTYPPETPDPMACLMADGFNYWQTVNTPKVSIEVSVANIKSDPKYKDFLQLQNMDVGYTGTVYFEQMGIDIDLKIVSIKKNELTGEAIQIVLGNAPNSFVRSPVMSQTIVPNGSVEAKQAETMKEMQNEIENVKLKSMKYWNGIKNYTWAEVKKYKWREIKNGKLDN